MRPGTVSWTVSHCPPLLPCNRVTWPPSGQRRLLCLMPTGQRQQCKAAESKSRPFNTSDTHTLEQQMTLTAAGPSRLSRMFEQQQVCTWDQGAAAITVAPTATTLMNAGHPNEWNDLLPAISLQWHHHRVCRLSQRYADRDCLVWLK